MKATRLIDRVGASLRYRSGHLSRKLAMTARQGLQDICKRITGGPDDALLYAVYDLNVLPASFDFLWFLAAAEVERRQRGLAGVHVVISLFERPYIHPAPVGHTDHISEDSMLWRVDTMLAPCCSLLPSCLSHAVSANADATLRALAGARHVWPESWASQGPGTSLTDIYNHAVNGLNALNATGPLKAPPEALRFISDWKTKVAGSRDLVTITLRDYHGSPKRNSRISDWVTFADAIAAEGFKPVFVPDAYNALLTDNRDYNGHETFATAAHHMSLRLALYEKAYLNLFVSNGPAYLAVLNGNCRYLMFKILVDGLQATSKEHLAKQGFPFNTTPHFATEYQEWVWEDDTANVIQHAFERMRNKIDGMSNRLGSAQ